MSRGRERAGRVLAALLLTGLVGGLAGACSATAADEPVRGGSQEGYVGAAKSITQVPPTQRQPAPVITGRELGGTKDLSTADYAGKVVVLNVWASWCGPCRVEAPDLQKASVTTAKKAQFLGLNTRDPAEAAAQAFVRTGKITYPSVHDPSGSVLLTLSGNLPLSAIPSTLVIDGQGRVAARIIGTITEGTLVDLIDDVAAGR